MSEQANKIEVYVIVDGYLAHQFTSPAHTDQVYHIIPPDTKLTKKEFKLVANAFKDIIKEFYQPLVESCETGAIKSFGNFAKKYIKDE